MIRNTTCWAVIPMAFGALVFAASCDRSAPPKIVSGTAAPGKVATGNAAAPEGPPAAQSAGAAEKTSVDDRSANADKAGVQEKPAVARESDAADKQANSSKEAHDDGDTVSSRASVSKPAAPAAEPTEPRAADGAGPSASASDVAARRDSAPKERIVLLMPGGPRVVDFIVTIGGKRPGESLTEEAKRVLSLVDKDADGRVTWDELTLDERFQRGQFGNQPLNTENERREFIKQRDVNRDKVVNMEEAASLFSRDSMRFQAFTVQDLASAADSVSRGSPLFRILDENEDGVIDEAERNNATARLLTRDADDDEALFSTELAKTTPTDNPRRMAARRRLSAPMHVWHLGPRSDWEGLLLAMQESYSLGGPLTPDVLPDATELFGRLDANGNKMLSRDELQRLVEVPADLAWRVDFLVGDESPVLKLIGEEKSPRRVTDSQWEEELGGARITWLAREAAAEPSDAGAKRLIAMFDGDKNGYLSDDETAPALGGLGLSLESVDTNDDKKLDLEELTSALERRRLAGSSRVR
ncbi:MAG TPA: hypothetical protein PLV92_18350, partial [Pirellulaceae bacterium]|nr:hypothetical protein [Pirellulaceae bacterium]